MAKGTQLSRITGELESLAESLGLEFVDYELKKEPGGVYLRLTVDKDGGLSLDDCEKFHRRSVAVVEDVEYDFLECSSPGIDRPLKKERDYLKHIGKQVEVRLFKPRDGQKIFVGELLEYIADGPAFDIAAAGGNQRFTVKEAALVKPFIDYEAELAKQEPQKENE